MRLNDRLRAERERQHLTRQALAERLQAHEIETTGKELGVDAHSIWRWEAGRRRVGKFYAARLEAVLRKSAVELGLTDGRSTVDDASTSLKEPADMTARLDSDADEDAGLAYAKSLRDALDNAAELGRQDVERRDFLARALFAVAASVAPSRDWLLATLDEAASARGRVSNGQVDAICRMFGAFQELDVMRGGGHARRRLAAYVNSHVLPLLRENDPTTTNGQALYEAGAEQLYLLGWMAFDNGEHALAQRYLIQSLRLAQAARSPELGAHVLAGLSDQATLTGNPDHGFQLARAGRAGLTRGRSNACLADLFALQARAEAAMGDVTAAAKSVHASEKAFENVTVDDEPEWARFIDPAYLNGEYAHAFRDLQRSDEASDFARLSIAESERQNRARRGSLAQAALARAALDAHELDVAASAGLVTAKLAATVKSSRSVDAVNDLRVRLQRHKTSPAVREFFDVSAALIPTTESAI